MQRKAAIRQFCQRLIPDLRGERVEPVMRPDGDDFLIYETICIGHTVEGRPFELTGRSG